MLHIYLHSEDYVKAQKAGKVGPYRLTVGTCQAHAHDGVPRGERIESEEEIPKVVLRFMNGPKAGHAREALRHSVVYAQFEPPEHYQIEGARYRRRVVVVKPGVVEVQYHFVRMTAGG